MKKWFFLFLIVGCSKNILQETADTHTPEAILYQAKLEMNDGDYNTAIQLLQQLSPTYVAQRSVALIYASAYSGRCGLNFVNLLTQIDTVGTSNTIFLDLMNLFPGGTVAKIDDCEVSESTLTTIGTYLQRNNDENILMGLSSFTKVGTILSTYADTDGNGTTDPAFDACDTVAFPDADVASVGSGIANSILSISQVSSSIASGTLSDIVAICAAAPALNVYCTTTDATSYTPAELKLLRSVLKTSTLGVGPCVGDLTICNCP